MLKRARIAIFVARSLAGEMDRDQPKIVSPDSAQARKCCALDCPNLGQQCGDIKFPYDVKKEPKVRRPAPPSTPTPPRGPAFSLDGPQEASFSEDRTIWLGIIKAVTKQDITAAAAGSEVRECEPRSLSTRHGGALGETVLGAIGVRDLWSLGRCRNKR